jgi:hypothetical protein
MDLATQIKTLRSQGFTQLQAVRGVTISILEQGTGTEYLGIPGNETVVATVGAIRLELSEREREVHGILLGEDTQKFLITKVSSFVLESKHIIKWDSKYYEIFDLKDRDHIDEYRVMARRLA